MRHKRNYWGDGKLPAKSFWYDFQGRYKDDSAENFNVLCQFILNILKVEKEFNDSITEKSLSICLTAAILIKSK